MPVPDSFRQLAAEVNNWGRWGDDDEIGTINLITADAVRRGVACAKTGKTFSLADISMLAIVHRVSEIFPNELKGAGLPHLHDWWARVMARPAAKYAYSNGTEETPKRPPI